MLNDFNGNKQYYKQVLSTSIAK